jgi:hypothetical protein
MGASMSGHSVVHGRTDTGAFLSGGGFFETEAIVVPHSNADLRDDVATGD